MTFDDDGYSYSTEFRDDGYEVTIHGDEDDVGVEIDVSLPDGVEPTDEQARVIETYAGNIRTYVQKNIDYSSSYANGPKIESVMKYGEVRSDELPHMLAKQIFVRGFLDKLSRFYNLYIDSEEPQVDESVEDTLLDMANYAVMLAAKLGEQSGEASTDD